MKDYEIFSNWVDKADSAPGERIKRSTRGKWLCSAAVKMWPSPSKVVSYLHPRMIMLIIDCKAFAFTNAALYTPWAVYATWNCHLKGTSVLHCKVFLILFFFFFFLKLFPKSSLYLSLTLLLLKRLEKHTTKLMVLLKANIGRDSGVSSHATGKRAYDGGIIQAFKSVQGPNFIASAYWNYA